MNVSAVAAIIQHNTSGLISLKEKGIDSPKKLEGKTYATWDMDIEKRQEFVYAFFPFMFGIYPYTVVTKKQKKAMKEAGVDYTYNSVYELTYTAVKKMLK